MNFSFLHVCFTCRLFEPPIFHNLIIVVKIAELEAPRRIILCKIFCYILYLISKVIPRHSSKIFSLRHETLAALSVQNFVQYAINLLRSLEGRSGSIFRNFSLFLLLFFYLEKKTTCLSETSVVNFYRTNLLWYSNDSILHPQCVIHCLVG